MDCQSNHQSMSAAAAAEFLAAGWHAFREGKAKTDCPYGDSEDFLRYLWQEGYFDASAEADGLILGMRPPEGSAQRIFCLPGLEARRNRGSRN
jgi:hypothetical protein